MGWLWGVLATFGLDWAAKLIRKILRAPERPLEVTIVPSTGTPEPATSGASLPGTTEASLQFLRAAIRAPHPPRNPRRHGHSPIDPGCSVELATGISVPAGAGRILEPTSGRGSGHSDARIERACRCGGRSRSSDLLLDAGEPAFEVQPAEVRPAGSARGSCRIPQSLPSEAESRARAFRAWAPTASRAGRAARSDGVSGRQSGQMDRTDASERSRDPLGPGQTSGPYRTRTCDPLRVMQVRYQLRQRPSPLTVPSTVVLPRPGHAPASAPTQASGATHRTAAPLTRSCARSARATSACSKP